MICCTTYFIYTLRLHLYGNMIQKRIIPPSQPSFHCRAWSTLLHGSQMYTNIRALCSPSNQVDSSMLHCFLQTSQTDHWLHLLESEPGKDSSIHILFLRSSSHICRHWVRYTHGCTAPTILWRIYTLPFLYVHGWYILALEETCYQLDCLLKTEVGSYQHGIYNIGSRTRPEARRPPGVDRSARSRPLAAARFAPVAPRTRTESSSGYLW